MINPIAKKIIAAALTVSTLAGGMSATTTATVFTTTAAVSVITAQPAAAAGQFCAIDRATGGEAFVSKTVHPKLHTRGGQRRGLRRAKRQWSNEVDKFYGEIFADLDDAKNVTNECQLIGGRMACTVSATPCSDS